MSYKFATPWVVHGVNPVFSNERMKDICDKDLEEAQEMGRFSLSRL